MRRLSMKSVLKRAALPALAVLAGCAVGPNFHQPAAPAGAGYSPTPLTGTHAAAGPLGTAQKFVQAQDIPGEWWTLFQSKPLDRADQTGAGSEPLDRRRASIAARRRGEHAGAGRKFLPQHRPAGQRLEEPDLHRQPLAGRGQ